MLKLPAQVKIVEVGPRDGLQSFSRWVDTDTKVAMIDCLSAAGLKVIEATSFARASVIPHLKDAELVLERIKRRPGTIYRALVPNAKGAERAAERSSAAPVPSIARWCRTPRVPSAPPRAAWSMKCWA